MESPIETVAIPESLELVRTAGAESDTNRVRSMEMISKRDPDTGAITVSTAVFCVLITEDGLKVTIGEDVVHTWSIDQHNADAPSPRSRSTKRGSR
jgi:hypothetical protein